MKFLSEFNKEIELKSAASLPGFEIKLSEDVVIESQINNPFFKGLKGMNILQLPKKMKGFRNNPDLKKFLDPVKVKTGIKAELNEKQFLVFQPNADLLSLYKLQASNQIFGMNEEISPAFVNYGLHNVKLQANMVIGNVIVLNGII